MMTIVDELERLRQRLGRSITLPTPPACQALLKQARSTGIPIGNLFVLSRPLAPYVRGSYDRASGDLWCHYDGRDDDGDREVMQCLLTLLAYVKLQLPPPSTLEQDWEQALAAHQEAFALAQAWNREDLFPASDLAPILAFDRHLYCCHVAAGELAGNLNPSIARNAYFALQDIRRQFQWSGEQFEAILGGFYEEDEEANAVVLDFDRTALRSRWLSTRTRKQDDQQNPFGVFALPQTPQTASALRYALEKAAHHRAENRTLSTPLPGTDATFLQIASAQDMRAVIEQVNVWLIEDFPECYARVQWRLYADTRGEEKSAQPIHLYRLCVEYASSHERERAAETSETALRELWVFVPARHRLETIEAAWQRYIRSWLAFQDVHCESLCAGLQSLWSWLAK